jgi:N-acetylmuramoyl-L-alanine amidase
MFMFWKRLERTLALNFPIPFLPTLNPDFPNSDSLYSLSNSHFTPSQTFPPDTFFSNSFNPLLPFLGLLMGYSLSPERTDPWSEFALNSSPPDTIPVSAQALRSPYYYPSYPYSFSGLGPNSPSTISQVPTKAVSGPYVEAQRHYQESIGDSNVAQIVLDNEPIEALFISPRNLDPNKSQSPLIIDAGHGGSDTGASASGTNEVAVIDGVVKELIEQALKDGRPVILTNPLHQVANRKKNNEQRAADASKLHKYFPKAQGVSLHANSGASSGHWIIWNDKGPKNGSDRLAAAIDDAFNSNSGIPPSGKSKILAVSQNIDKDGAVRGQSLVETGEIPLVLVEMGFIDNEKEREAMLENPEAYAQAIYKGLDGQFIDRSTGTEMAFTTQPPWQGAYSLMPQLLPYGYPPPYFSGYPSPQGPLIASGNIL